MSESGARLRSQSGSARRTAWALLFVSGIGVAAASSARGQVTPTPAPRKPDVIAFTRLTADARIPIGLAPGAVATDDAVWVRTPTGVTRIDVAGNTLAPAVALPAAPCASLAVAFGSVWAPLCGPGTVARVDLKTNAVTTPLTLRVADPAGRIATAVGSVWVPSESTVLSRVDPDTSDVVGEAFVARGAAAVAASDDALWISSGDGDVVTRVSPYTNAVIETVKVGPKPGPVVVGEGAVWVLNRGDGSVSRIDPKTSKVVATIPVEGGGAGDLAVGAGAVWVSAPGLPLVRIDPAANRVAQRFTGDGGGAVLVAHGSLWLAAGPGVTWRVDPMLAATLRPE